MLAGLIAHRLRLGFASATPHLSLDYALDSISCEHCRPSRNNPHYAPRHIIYYYYIKIYKFELLYFFHFNLKKYDSNSENSLFKKNMWHTKQTLRWKIICLNKVYKFSVEHFSIRCIFYVLFLKTLSKTKNSIF